ncbi:uncharacterized protein LOC109611640 [Musca domestica]|uniref:Uncharacterized protein LOC109611640 n=1 Tax=Musca domestica TaxID=7370 RepID=A0A9J7DBH9_MUSDO|nr:uncharacterized protein LOC109611640 [Musca domestica]
MVYTNRTEKCISSQDNPGVKASANANSKYQSSCVPSYSSGSASGNKSTNNAWSKNASEADKWKYNNMVRENRDKFNSMHFC